MAYKKDPNAVLDYHFDWTAWLAPVADSIVSVAWVLTGSITKVSDSFTTTGATAFISGGVIDEETALTCRITTSGGRTDDRTIVLKITNR